MGDVAAGADVTVRELDGLAELALVDALFARVWGSTGAQVAMPVNLLRAVAHAGGYVAGAWRDGRLVGAGVGFVSRGERGVTGLHSHVVGVERAEQGRGVGRAIKLHQRAWAAAAGLDAVTWTFDPLHRGNGWFNLTRLGARAVRYYPDFYGPMVDDLNGTDETDRCLVHWPTRQPFTASSGAAGGGAEASGAGSAVPVLDADGAGRPVVTPAPTGHTGPLTCLVPPDIVALRRSDPDRARAWRLALRAAMGGAMEAGRVATAVTPDGRYVLEVAR